jgi:hypothetical protein
MSRAVRAVAPINGAFAKLKSNKVEDHVEREQDRDPENRRAGRPGAGQHALGPVMAEHSLDDPADLSEQAFADGAVDRAEDPDAGFDQAREQPAEYPVEIEIQRFGIGQIEVFP